MRSAEEEDENTSQRAKRTKHNQCTRREYEYEPLLLTPSHLFRSAQDNGTVYCTVPATSTQGAIKEEDKAKQEVGGVQLTRLSFPPTIDVGKVNEIIGEALKSIYAATMLAK